MDTKAEIIALLEGRSEESLENIRQFIQDEDEVAYHKFLYPIDPDFPKELEEHVAEARTITENVREIDATLRGLDRGRIKIQ